MLSGRRSTAAVLKTSAVPSSSMAVRHQCLRSGSAHSLPLRTTATIPHTIPHVTLFKCRHAHYGEWQQLPHTDALTPRTPATSAVFSRPLLACFSHYLLLCLSFHPLVLPPAFLPAYLPSVPSAGWSSCSPFPTSQIPFPKSHSILPFILTFLIRTCLLVCASLHSVAARSPVVQQLSGQRC